MSSVYQKSALVFRVVGAPYMIAACVAMTQAAPGVCISPATAMLVVSGHCKSTCIPTESRDPGCWGSWLCHESVIAVAISLFYQRLPYFRKGRTLRTSLPRHSFQGHGSFCGSDNTGFPWFLCRAGSLSAPMTNEIHRREPWKPKLVIQKHPWEDIMLVSPLFMSWVVRLKVLKNQSMLLFLHFWKIFYLFHSRNSQLYHQLRIAAVMMNYSPSQTRGRIHKCDSWAFKEVQIEYVYSNMVLFLIMKAYF